MNGEASCYNLKAYIHVTINDSQLFMEFILKTQEILYPPGRDFLGYTDSWRSMSFGHDALKRSIRVALDSHCHHVFHMKDSYRVFPHMFHLNNDHLWSCHYCHCIVSYCYWSTDACSFYHIPCKWKISGQPLY